VKEEEAKTTQSVSGRARAGESRTVSGRGRVSGRVESGSETNTVLFRKRESSEKKRKPYSRRITDFSRISVCCCNEK
jgi:hypothetical protein